MEAGGVAAENAPTGRPSAAPAPRSFVASKTRRGFLATSLKERTRRREFAVLKCHFSAAHGPPSTAARVPAHGGDMASLFLATSQGAAPPASPPHAALTALRSTLFDSTARPTGGRKRERPANERAAAPASPKRARASDAPGTPASRSDVGDEPPRAHAAPPSGDAEPGDAGAQRDTAGENTAGAAAAAASPAPSPRGSTQPVPAHRGSRVSPAVTPFGSTTTRATEEATRVKRRRRRGWTPPRRRTSATPARSRCSPPWRPRRGSPPRSTRYAPREEEVEKATRHGDVGSVYVETQGGQSKRTTANERGAPQKEN